MFKKITILFSICLLSFHASAQLVDVVTGITNPWALAIKGNDLYIGADGGQLLKVDISQASPTATVLLSNIGLAGGLAFHGDDLYMGLYTSGKVVKVDLSPSPPTMTDFYTNGISLLNGIIIEGDSLYLIDEGTNNITKVDITQPTTTTVYASQTNDLSGGLAIKDNYLFYSDYISGIIYKLDKSKPMSTPQVVVSGLNSPFGLTLNGNFLYIAEKNQISRIDLGIAMPTPETVVSGLNSSRLCAFNGLDLYISQYEGFKVSKLNISQPIFGTLAKACSSNATASLGGASPTGGVYSGANVVDDGNGTSFTFNAAVAGLGTHPVTYTIGGIAANSNVEVVAPPTVTMNLVDELHMTPSTPLLGVPGGGMPVGGVYTDPYQEIMDDGNGLTFSFLNTVMVDENNVITYTYTDANGCSNAVSEIVFVSSLPSGVDQLADFQAYAFPNPSTGLVTIQGIQVESIRVIDALGRVVMHQETPQSQIDISKLPAGVYNLLLELGDQKQALTKVVKE